MQSIIIPTYRSEKEIQNLVDEINKKSTGEFELIVTSQKGSAAVNRNYGLKKAKSTTIIMVDDDVKDFPYGWNEELVRPLMEMENVVLVSARLLSSDGKTLGMTMSSNYNVKDDVVIIENGYSPTACIAFLMNDILFDENFVGSGWEDTSFNNDMMIKYPKGLHVINNLVKVVHINEMKNQHGENWEKNKVYYESKWKGFTGRKPRIKFEDKKISLCMIVRNEEKNLARCLNSAKGKVDEIIIVDTGSKDGTKSIAEKYGAKIIDFEWCDDFAAARNVGIEVATGDWILVLDADEELLGEKEDLLEMANVPLSNRSISYMVRIENIMDGGAQVEHHMARMFTNKKSVRYHGAIHEHMKDGESNLLSVVTDRIKIRHHGYGGVDMKNIDKKTRNADLLLAELEKCPDSAFYRYHLGITYRVAGETDKALEQLEKWHELVSKLNEPVDLSMGYAALLGIYITLNKTEKGAEIGNLVAGKCSHNPDFCLNFGINLEHQGKLDEAIAYCKKAIGAKASKFPALSYDRDSMGWKALAVLGNIYAKKGESAQAFEKWEAALKYVPDNIDITRALFGLHLAMGNLLKAEPYLVKLMSLDPIENEREDNKINLANIWYNSGRSKDALELFWTMDKRVEFLDQLLVNLISHQQFNQVKEIDDFIKSKKEGEEK